ncbi:hypothetical protein RH915_06325 [Serpentinicella sp. ANB-PHB4]|uniref:hypothetical protein n=1 Tax=Serpentinicella sp. ANB-PHB4 TaxID=3074076 RepID=UPI00285DE808|nr:hypothetical protein [Serpentinicella sp. ANB-PHB4]MDR5659099.1 hypothetical protein [Serpentinicella sp. ANB-PHB4]
MNKVDILAQISDLKNIDYRNTLAIATLIEVLVEQGIITRSQFAKQAHQLDNMSLEELKAIRAQNDSIRFNRK